ncbi:hypothetical protein EUX98_g690 [Antrodiella citrinella]|uniref:Uncharacterized protein n=1 Tax=Antrodiella citrinella TaxID=2447956 RepID=A0A4S4N6H6_9APHY|nr:hypothetical protein EUX98_g690 [Antrodiella citrinella]
MPLIKRYNQVAEYSELISTKPRTGSSSAGIRSRHGRGGSPTIADEASGWLEAVCPSDIQSAVRRFQNHPDLSQEKVFGFLYPIYVFALLFALAVVALQPKSFAHHVLADPRGHPREMTLGVAALAGAMLVGLAFLRIVIWGIAVVAVMVVDRQMERGFPAPPLDSTEQPLTTAALLRGVFT